MGVSEETDAIALVVSEETGALSICHRGKLEHDLEPGELRARLNQLLNADASEDEPEQEEPTRELGSN